VTDANGIVEFLTIYPGWYSGRTVHIHFKIRTPSASQLRSCTNVDKLWWALPVNAIISFSGCTRQCPPYKKLLVENGARSQSQQSYEFTSQLYFDDSLTDQIHAQPPYAAKEQRSVKNDRDGIFQ
jgi:protocatechuate 3,4-dioxygenase beta subunit